MGAKGKIYIGTSGWHYKHWKGPFYPENMKTEEFLSYYSDRFDTSEVNNSFYKLPEKERFHYWKKRVGEDFLFSVKASRYITHMKKLKDPQDSLSRFMDSVSELGEKLGPILFQLPPKWNSNLKRLTEFLDELSNYPHRAVFEFRDTSWFNSDIYDTLSDHNTALCIYHMEGWQTPKEITADFVYIRLHGPNGKYQGQYSGRELAGWAGAIWTWSGQGKDIYCYFDNDDQGFAALDALRLKEMAPD